MKKTFVAAFLALLTTALFGATPAGGEAALRLRTAGRLLGHAMTNQIGEHQVVVCEEEAYEIQKAVLGAGSPEVVQTLRQMLRHNWNSLDRIRSKELVKRLREQAKLEGPEIALDAAEHARQTALNGDDTEAVEAADKELKEQEEALRASLSPEMQKLWKEGEALDKQLEPFLKGYTNSPAFIEARDDQLKQTLAAAVAANDYLEKNGYTAEHLLEQQRLQGATPETLAALESQFKLQAKHRNEGVEVMKKWASTSGKIDEAQMAEEIAEGNKRLQREMMELAAKDSEALKGYKPFEENGQKRGNLAKAAAQAVEKKGGKVPTNPAAGNSGDDQKPERWFDDGWKLLNESYERGQPLSQLLLLRENLNGLHSVPQRVADEPAWLVKAVLNSQSRVFELEDRLMTALGDCNEPDVKRWATRLFDAQIGLIRDGARVGDTLEDMKALGSMGDRMQEESRFRVLAQSLIGNVQANPIGWRDLRIPQGGMLVNYAIVGLASNPRAPHVSHYAAVLARSGETPSWKVLAPCTEVDAVVRELHGLLALGVATPTQEARAEELLQKLHSQLVTPWMPLASGTTRDLFIVPDGELHAVPFACLMEKWEFLGDRFTLHQLKSCRSLLGAKPTKLASRAVESWGNPNYSMAARPMAESGGIKAFFKDLFRDDRAYGDLKELPGTGEEATIVEEIFTAKGYAVNKRTWNDANEANIRQLASPYVLHIGTHGIIRTPPTNQTDTDIIGLTNERFQSHGAYYTSGIALSGASFARQSWKEGTALAPDTDGIILSSEVARLRLTGTKLVTLSACDSGAGTAAAGEGVLGLKSALFQAGAENVLLALWRVDDAYAPEFFRVFYQEFVKDGNPANALSVAQRKAFKEIRGRTKGNLFKTVRMAGPFVVTER